MPGPVPLPRSIDGLGRDWFQAALGTAHAGTEVAGAQVLDVLGGSLTKIRVRLDYRSNPADLPSSVYVKAAFEDHGIPVSVRSEALFYDRARPLVELEAPRCLHAGHDDEHGVIVLEDLEQRGCVMSDPTRSWTPDTVADGLGQLSSLHARWWGEGRVPGIPPLEGSNALGAVLLEAGYWESCIDGPTGVHVPADYRDREAMAPSIRSLWDLDDAPPRCFVHGDAHLGNTYTDPDGRPGFLDWGGVTTGHWAREVCYFLAGALSIDDRRAHEQDLLAHYLDSLAGHGVADPPQPDVAWLDYRRHLVHGLLWFLCPTPMQPEAVINANVERFGAAVTDHDVRSLF
ncbi:MAG: aminoglycoside phosphotransferase family protein [Acidimicrobiia bacterium]|nr:aminoglycoside phosphotransferase family protein [Acidimicrobiia bacterium]